MTETTDAPALPEALHLRARRDQAAFVLQGSRMELEQLRAVITMTLLHSEEDAPDEAVRLSAQVGTHHPGQSIGVVVIRDDAPAGTTAFDLLSDTDDRGPDVTAFSRLMQRELDANSHKGPPDHWKNTPPQQLWDDLIYHAAKLLYAYQHGDQGKVGEFAPDTANMSMMFFQAAQTTWAAQDEALPLEEAGKPRTPAQAWSQGMRAAAALIHAVKHHDLPAAETQAALAASNMLGTLTLMRVQASGEAAEPSTPVVLERRWSRNHASGRLAYLLDCVHYETRRVLAGEQDAEQAIRHLNLLSDAEIEGAPVQERPTPTGEQIPTAPRSKLFPPLPDHWRIINEVARLANKVPPGMKLEDIPVEVISAHQTLRSAAGAYGSGLRAATRLPKLRQAYRRALNACPNITQPTTVPESGAAGELQEDDE